MQLTYEQAPVAASWLFKQALRSFLVRVSHVLGRSGSGWAASFEAGGWVDHGGPTRKNRAAAGSSSSTEKFSKLGEVGFYATPVW